MGWLTMLLCCSSGLALLVRRPRPATRRAAARRSRRAPTLSVAGYARPAALLAGAALAATSGPILGVLVGGSLWWLLPALVAQTETRGEAERRERLAAQLPVAASLLASCLAAGAPLGAALAATAEASVGSAREVLGEAAQTVALGGCEHELARVLSRCGEPGWQSLGSAVVRSAATGAPLADVLLLQSDAALRSWSSRAMVRARAASVRIVLPLALCYLPAFLLLAVVPVVAGLLAGIEFP